MMEMTILIQAKPIFLNSPDLRYFPAILGEQYNQSLKLSKKDPAFFRSPFLIALIKCQHMAVRGTKLAGIPAAAYPS